MNKRVVIPPVEKALSVLFGTVSEEEIQVVKRKLKKKLSYYRPRIRGQLFP